MGRLSGVMLRLVRPDQDIDPGVYALIGAAAFSSGVTRMTISLSVIMLEITNDLQFLPPIMFSVMIAKWVGDIFTFPLYDVLLALKGIPFIDSEPPYCMEKMDAHDIMTKDVKMFPLVVSIGHIIETLKNCNHNGFPVIDTGDKGQSKTLKGLIIRRQLTVLLETKIWTKKFLPQANEFRRQMAREQKPIEVIEDNIDDHEKDYQLDLRPYMNCSPFSVTEEFYSIYAFRLFRSMGLRHLPVVDDNNQVKGIITRKDIIDSAIFKKSDEIQSRRQKQLQQQQQQQQQQIYERSVTGSVQSP